MLFSFKSNRWEWEISRIEAETDLTHNMADIVVERIYRLPESVRKLLMMAACLGSQFDPELVALIIHYEEEGENRSTDSFRLVNDQPEKAPFVVPPNVKSIESDLQFLYMTHLVESGSVGLTKFSHEKIQQVSYQLTPDNGRELLHLRIGRILYQLHNDARFNDEWIFFAAVDQLNRGCDCIIHPDDRIQLARLNMTAGEVAKSRSAFIIAAEYLKCGARLLDSTGGAWDDDHYELTLELYSNAAEMEHCAGNADYCRAMIDQIIRNAHSLTDRLRAHLVEVNLLGSQGQLAQAVRTGLKIMKELGVSFPSKPRVYHIVGNVIKTRRMVKNMSDDDLLNGPSLKDSTRLLTLEVMQVTIIYAYVFQKGAYLPLMLLRFMQLSLQGGLSEYSGFAYANYAQILASSGEIEEGYRFANLALKLLDSTKEFLKPSVLYLVHSSLYHWKNPLRASLNDILKSYSLGMESGNIEAAMSSSGVYCMLYAFSGLPLAPVSNDMRRFMQQMMDYNQDTAHMTMAPVWQYVLNLMGRSKFPCILTGEAMDQFCLMKNAKVGRNSIAVKNILRYRFFLAVQYFNTDLAELMMKEVEEHKDDTKSSFGYAREIFSIGLTLLAKAKSTGKNLYARKACKYIRMIEKWTKLGNVNCHDMMLLLQAESMSLSDRTDVTLVRDAYNKAISSSSRSGYIHNAALASELAADYFQRKQQRGVEEDQFWKKHYVSQAHELYLQWNAWGKVRTLEIAHPELREKQKASRGSTPLQGRSRFDRKVQANHGKLTFRRSLMSMDSAYASSDDASRGDCSDDGGGGLWSGHSRLRSVSFDSVVDYESRIDKVLGGDSTGTGTSFHRDGDSNFIHDGSCEISTQI